MFKYQNQIDQMLGKKLKPQANGQVYTHCPLHIDTRQSFSINLEKGLWKCHAGCGSGNILQLTRIMGKEIGVVR